MVDADRTALIAQCRRREGDVHGAGCRRGQAAVAVVRLREAGTQIERQNGQCSAAGVGQRER